MTVGLHSPSQCSRRAAPDAPHFAQLRTGAARSNAVGALALGAVAAGAFAVGALALGAVAIALSWLVQAPTENLTTSTVLWWYAAAAMTFGLGTGRRAPRPAAGVLAATPS